MANSWASSRVLTEKSWAVLNAHRGLLSFTIAAFFINILVVVVFAILAIVLFVVGNWVTVVIGIAVVLAGLYLTQIVGFVAKGGMVVCADDALAGRPMGIGAGWARSLRHSGDIAQWAFISMVVGVLLGAIRGNGQGNLVSVLLRNVVAAAAGVAWSIITLFVLPAIVLDDSGVINAIKSSANVVKERWGTQISGNFRIAARLILLILPGIALALGGVFAAQVSIALAAVLIVLGVLLMTIAGLLAGTVRTIFSVALYRFVTNGETLGGFTAEELQSSVRTRG